MMHRSVGLVSIVWCCVAIPALAQTPKPAPTAVGPSSGAFPGAEAPPPPPPLETDLRPNRQRRPFIIGGELGWNGLSGLGVLFSYHPIPYFAIDTGAGLSITGWRLGIRARANFLTGEWTPFLGGGLSYASGTGGRSIEIQSKGEKTKLEVLPSPFLQIAGGVNYTGNEGFMFMATTGYAILLDRPNTRYVNGSLNAYNDVKAIYDGGLIVSVAFGYAF
jgi:hypothetical protein